MTRQDIRDSLGLPIVLRSTAIISWYITPVYWPRHNIAEPIQDNIADILKRMPEPSWTPLKSPSPSP